MSVAFAAIVSHVILDFDLNLSSINKKYVLIAVFQLHFRLHQKLRYVFYIPL